VPCGWLSPRTLLDSNVGFARMLGDAISTERLKSGAGTTFGDSSAEILAPPGQGCVRPFAVSPQSLSLDFYAYSVDQ
jgi:hypothetical protein